MSRRSSEQRGKRRANTGGRYSEDFKGFVDVVLTDRDREDIAALLASEPLDFTGFIQTALEDGYKISVAGDFEHGQVIATLTGRSDTCDNKGYALSGRGPDVLGALACLYHKHATKCNYGPWVQPDAEGDTQLPLWS